MGNAVRVQGFWHSPLADSAAFALLVSAVRFVFQHGHRGRAPVFDSRTGKSVSADPFHEAALRNSWGVLQPGERWGPGAVELVGEGVDEEVDPVEIVGDLPASVDLAAPYSDGALDVPIKLRGSRREHPEGDAAPRGAAQPVPSLGSADGSAVSRRRNSAAGRGRTRLRLRNPAGTPTRPPAGRRS